MESCACESGSTPCSPSRRGFLHGAAVVGGIALLPALAACGEDTPATTTGSNPTTGAEGEVIVATSAIPVGGGMKLPKFQMVVTQPTAGKFYAFSSTCTHQQCQVEGVADGTINCGCHGSKFNITDGSVKNGPAQTALPAVAIAVKGSNIVRA